MTSLLSIDYLGAASGNSEGKHTYAKSFLYLLSIIIVVTIYAYQPALSKTRRCRRHYYSRDQSRGKILARSVGSDCTLFTLFAC